MSENDKTQNSEEEPEIKKYGEKILDSLLNIFFSKKKLAIFGFFVLGFVLRFISARNAGVYADDANNAIVAVNIFNSGKLTLWGQMNSLFYYVMDIFYKIFGTTQFTSRIPALLFGSASIILIYLFAKEFFKSEKIGFISAFLLSVSPWHIRNTLPEMDVTVLFFVMLSGLFLVRAINSIGKQKRNMFFAGIAIGIALLIKLYAMFFAFSFVLYYIYKKRSEIKTNWRPIVIFIVTGAILFSPSIIANYLLYQDQGFVDFIPTNIFGLGKEKAEQFYGWDAGWDKKPDYVGFFTKTIHLDAGVPGAWLTLRYLLYANPIIFIIGFLGLFLCFKRNKNYFIFFLLSFIPIWFYISSVIPLSKHLLFEDVLFIPLAALFIEGIHEKLRYKTRLKHILIVILVFNLIWLGINNSAVHGQFYSENAISKFIKYKNENIAENSLVLFDNRIYRGRMHWMAHDRPHLEVASLQKIQEAVKKFNSSQIPVETYFVECVQDDCGWGSIKNQPELNQSMENYVNFFANASVSTQNIRGVLINEAYHFPLMGGEQEIYRVYKTTILFKPEVLAFGMHHNWFLYPVGWDIPKSEVFGHYETHGFIGFSLDYISYKIFYIALVLVFIELVVVFYMFGREK